MEFGLSGRWLGVGPQFPSDFDTAVIRSDRVTVGGNRAAFATLVESGTLNIDGALTSDVTIQNDASIVNRGTIAGDMTWEGKLAIEHADTLTVEGTVYVADGTLATASAYAQPRGTYTGDFVLVHADELVGLLAQSAADHLGDGVFLHNLSSDASQIVVDLYSALPGDANGDGITDGADFFIWNTFKFQTGTDWTSGDFNGDGITDGSDFVIWNQNKFVSADASTPVPEPNAWILLVGILCCRPMVNESRRRRRGVKSCEPFSSNGSYV